MQLEAQKVGFVDQLFKFCPDCGAHIMVSDANGAGPIFCSACSNFVDVKRK